MSISAVSKSNILFEYPKNTELNRVLPKNKIYEQGSVNSATKSLFIEQIDQIIWQNKLSAQTLNIEPVEAIPEIQIFIIKLKGTEISHDVLTVIDKAIPLPIIFELHTTNIDDKNDSGSVKIVSAYKQLFPTKSSEHNNKIEISNYFESQWLTKSTSRNALPISLNIQSLYEQLIRSLLPVAAIGDESITQQIKRISQIKKLEKSLSQLNKKLNNEKQFKHKVTLNNQVRELKQELKNITLVKP